MLEKTQMHRVKQADRGSVRSWCAHSRSYGSSHPFGPHRIAHLCNVHGGEIQKALVMKKIEDQVLVLRMGVSFKKYELCLKKKPRTRAFQSRLQRLKNVMWN